MMNYIPQLFAGNETLPFVASVLIQATLVIVLALVAGRLLRFQPLLRHSVLLGGLVCVLFSPVATYVSGRIDVPLFSITWPSTAASYPHRTTQAAVRQSAAASLPDEALHTLVSRPPSVTSTRRAMSPDVRESDSTFSQLAAEHATGALDRVLPDETPRALSGNEVSHGGVWTDAANAAGLAWLAGMAVISIRLVLAWRYLCHLRSHASPLNGDGVPRLQQVSDEVLKAVDTKRRPTVLISDGLQGPISLGLFRPAIILPREMLQSLSVPQLRDVLIHEVAHIHRYDHVVVLLQRLAGAMFWPFPLVWRLNAKIDEAREDVCDNYVLRHTEASQYSRMLLQLTERATPQAVPLATGLWKCRRKLEQRVTALLDPRRTTIVRLPRLALCTLAVAFAAMVVLLAGARIIPASRVQAAESQQAAGDASKRQGNEEGKRAAARDEPKPAAAPANDQADPYDTLYDVIMTRWKDGKAYAQDETSPVIFSWSEFPFDDQTFDKFNGALDAFAALPQEKMEQYSDVQRALMQRNLWEVFDTTFNWNWPENWWWGRSEVLPEDSYGTPHHRPAEDCLTDQEAGADEGADSRTSRSPGSND